MTLRSLNAIGFARRSRQELATILAAIVDQHTEPIFSDTGVVRHWRGSSGAEIMFRYQSPPRDRRADDSVHALTDLVGLSPFHHGQGALSVTPLAAFSGAAADPAAGLWQIALQADPHTGRAPELLVEMVPFEPVVTTTAAPLARNLQIVGFCHRIDVFSNTADYLLRLSPRLLCPPGSIVPAASAETLHRRIGKLGQAAAMITGEVRQQRRLTNPVTGHAYHWLLVATERGQIDLLAPIDDATAKLTVGSLVCAHADLVARPTESGALVGQLPVFAPQAPPEAAAATIDNNPLRSAQRVITAA